ncbi:hypothetical protein [Chromobacterium violaceum]|uniref:Uncharacterized protein n=1 Tax=Chromobacterium violaceum (strain ATCC 12472 / DSM 30191 / JCM 1249 / CCUG 213 / NBRC 12614 / NCIMB 9131 / NCTC 9757 / MK) TaxID=243365 RepID=Q7NUU2_CHRVO|nr:hypothetical protein [Chromobacterium violaceum]AAQ60275.1 hypothetical protein CV_2605 [Chromobacterium violaceum ATCC 12472]SUX35802.1 Uncharacterised protein [Chromobacterium violaceum]
MDIFPLHLRRYASQMDDNTHHGPSDEHDEKHFAALMAAAETQPDPQRQRPNAGAWIDFVTSTAGPRLSASQSTSAQEQPLPQAAANKLDHLRLRLTNGPLAGLELEAECHGIELLIKLRSLDLQACRHAFGSASELECMLSQQFDRPVQIEVIDANSPLK